MSLVGKLSFSYFELCFFKVTYSRLPITGTLANSNLALTRTKINFPWISFIHLLSFYLDNSNLPLTRSYFCFPSDHLYITLPSITRNVLQSVLKYILTQPCILCQSTSNIMSSPDDEYSSNFVASIPFSKYQFIPCCP